MTLHVLSFNNYYNRIIKVINDNDTLPIIYSLYNTNFIPNDSIETEVIIGDTNLYDGSGDYAILINDNNMIASRWWIIKHTRTRGGQYRVLLKRDVIADNYNNVINSPCFIEKATLSIENPLIFNKENMGFNQIKTKEIFLKDKSKIPWITFYLDRSVTDQQTFTIPASQVSVDGEYDSLEQYPYYAYCNYNPSAEPYYGNYSNLNFGINTAEVYADFTAYDRFVWNSGLSWISRESLFSSPGADIITDSNYNEIIDTIRTVGKRYSDWHERSYGYTKANTEINVSKMLEESNRLYFIGGKYYKITIEQSSDFTERIEINPLSGLGTYFEAIKNNLEDPIISGSGSPYTIYYTVPSYSIYLTQIDIETLTLTIPSNRTHCTNVPYDVLCIPCGDIILSDNDVQHRLSSDVAFKFAAEIGKKSNAQVFDVQLLPYTLLSDSIFETSLTSLSIITPADVYTENTDYFYVKNNDDILSVCFSLSSNKARKFLEGPIIKSADTAIERKVNNECDMYRLCSPNYDGVFEFSAEKNNGVDSWVTNLTYKPYSPYICIAPMFKNLYGRNFNDSRGLICGGEFSLPRVTSNWETYELNNKNYQRSFDRQIENMEFNNNLQRTQAWANLLTGTVSGGVAGAVAGSMTPVGGLAGGAIGGIASLAGGIADINILAQQQKETLDYTKDLFGYQLGNIKALPHTLNKIGAFDITNKIFPFIEYYTCTDIEKEALRNKLKFNGMTVMTIGNIADYIQPEKSYIKASIIRCEDLENDYNTLLTISEELNKGVFI